MYIWQKPNWPQFDWDDSDLLVDLSQARHKEGIFIGMMRTLDFDLRLECESEAVVEDAVKTSLIESVVLNLEHVRSSVAHYLGLSYAGLFNTDRSIDGLVKILLEATHYADVPLTNERLYRWHVLLFPHGIDGFPRNVVGQYRTNEMEVVSGYFGRIKVHYQAPPADRLEIEMARFLDWFNKDHPELDNLIYAAIAHLWFVDIHPFQDGNGRLARVIVDLALAKTDHMKQRFYSLSSAIETEKKHYYGVLERAGMGNGNITEYLKWFINCYSKAVQRAEYKTNQVLTKHRFYQNQKDNLIGLSQGQTKVLELLLNGTLEQISEKKIHENHQISRWNSHRIS